MLYLPIVDGAEDFMEERCAWQVDDTNSFTARHRCASGKRPPQPGPQKPRVEHAGLQPEGVEVRHLGEQLVPGARVVEDVGTVRHLAGLGHQRDGLVVTVDHLVVGHRMAALQHAPPHPVDVDGGVVGRHEVQIDPVAPRAGVPHEVDLRAVRHDGLEREGAAFVPQFPAHGFGQRGGQVGVPGPGHLEGQFTVQRDSGKQGRHVQAPPQAERLEAAADPLQHRWGLTRHAELPQPQAAAGRTKRLLDLVGVHEGADPLGLEFGLQGALAGSVRPCEDAQARLGQGRPGRQPGVSCPVRHA